MIGNSLPILGKTSYDRRAKLDALNKLLISAEN